MANRFFNQFSQALEKGRVQLFARVAIGSTGAPTLSAVNSKGVASITRNGVGTYTIVLQDSYVKLFNVSNSTFLASGTPTHVENPYIKADAVATLASKSFQIVFLDFAGAAVDPGSGEQLRLQIDLSNSTAI